MKKRTAGSSAMEGDRLRSRTRTCFDIEVRCDETVTLQRLRLPASSGKTWVSLFTQNESATKQGGHMSLDFDNAQTLKEKVAQIAQSYGYSVGLAREATGWAIAVRTQGNPGSEQEFRDSLKGAGIDIGDNLEFQVSGRARMR